MRVVLCLLIGLFAAACTTTQGGDSGAGPAGSPTAGWSLRMHRQHVSAQQYVLYELNDRGKLIYTAGKSALPGGSGDLSPTWTGVLSESDFAPIVAMLRAAGDVQTTPTSDARPEYRLSLTSPGALFPALFHSGSTPFMDGLYAELQRLQVAKRSGTFDLPVVEPKY